ncbi:MAG: alpha/beta hydrolase domain-containing protein [bacterium]|nr:alpha/beta hydrolase domain-containing protein [bacterium]
MLHSLDISSRQVVLDGRDFGDSGPYEQLYGSARFALDPTHLRNTGIIDLTHAPVDANGQVNCRADIWILKPADAARGNGALFYHVVNRGRNGVLASFQLASGSNTPSVAAEFGDGLLMEHGFTMAAVGWQEDVPLHGDQERNLLTLDVPILAGVTGPVACEIVVDAPTQLHSLGSRYHDPYEWSEAHRDEAVLSVRDEPYAAMTAIAQDAWHFDRLSDGRAAIRLPSGFEPGRIYHLVYTGRDPRVVGLGFATTRDFVSFLKYEQATTEGQPNPLARHLQRAHAFGSSQSGRFLRDLLHQGFNQDEADRQVFDGLFVSVGGGGGGSFNHRFAQPSRHAGAHTDVFYPTERYPFHDLPQPDAAAGAGSTATGLLDVCRTSQTMPKIFYTNTSTEYWNRSTSLIHTTTDGQQDAAPHADTRIYHFAGTQHGPGGLPDMPSGNTLPANPVDFHFAFRALALALDAWVRDATPPPPSAHASLAAGTLVPLEEVRWPRLPGLPLPTHPRQPRRLDWGDHWQEGRIDREPPGLGSGYPVRFPQVDEDGNEIDGIQMPEVAVPLGTFTGWRYRTREMGASWALAGLAGVWFPFPATEAAAAATGDPRRPLTERYRDRDDYVQRCVAVADALVARRLLLQRDVARVESRAVAMYEYATSP